MIDQPSQAGPFLPNQGSSENASQTRTTTATSAKRKTQAGTLQRRHAQIVKADKYSLPVFAAFFAIETRAFTSIAKKGYLINQVELNVLRALGAFCRGEYLDGGIIQIRSFIDRWHLSMKQAKPIGGLTGLSRRGYVQVFDKRKNGIRYVGITPLGAKVLEVYYQAIEDLLPSFVLRREQFEYKERAEQFQKVPAEQVGQLYTTGMTTKNRHLYDSSKYFNPDGSIKN